MTGRIAVAGGPRLEAAVDQVQEVGQLGGGGQEDVVDVLPLGDEAPEAMDAGEVLLALGDQDPSSPTAQRELSDGDAHREEQQGGLHVVGRVDPERQVGLRVEQVEGGRRRECRDDGRRASST